MLAFLFIASVLAGVEQTNIRPGAVWKDTDGNRIYAGGANILLEDGTYYWVGEGKKDTPGYSGDISACFNVYSSEDLGQWKFEGCALHNADIVANVKGPYRMERPKLFVCPSNKKHMMAFHCDTPSFGIQSVGIAEADSVVGPYKMVKPCFQPNGLKSYDMGTFQDDTGTYLVRSVANQYAGISKFTDDCTDVSQMISRTEYATEGQAIMNSNGTYYLWGSHLTGWAANPAIFAVGGSSLAGATWKQLGNPTKSSTTFDSQSTFILPYRHADGHTTFMYMGDRWNAKGPGGLQNSSYIWLPMTTDSRGDWEVQWRSEWKFGDF